MPTAKDAIERSVKSHLVTQWNKLEKILLQVVGGTLAASASAILFSGDGALFTYRHVLLVSWILLTISLISLLLSYAFSEWEARLILRKLKIHKPDVSENEYQNLVKTFCEPIIHLLNYLALGSGVIGIIVLVLFVYLNV